MILYFLDEVFIDGLVLPVTTWIVLTFAAQKLALQFEREKVFELQQRFTQRLTENRDYGDLVTFITSFPSTLLPLDHASLFVYNQRVGKFNFVKEWHAPDVADTLTLDALKVLPACQTCASPEAAKLQRAVVCSCAANAANDTSGREYRFLLIHDNLQIGILRVRCRAGETATAAQLKLMTSLAPDMAMSLAMAIADSQQTEQVYRKAQILERRQIAQELHNRLAQQVFFLHLSLDQLSDDTTLIPNDTARRKVESMRDVAADVYSQVRNNLSILRAWEQVDITEAVSELARSTASNAGLEIDIEVYGQPEWLSPHTCEHLYGVVQEALNNVAKHAQAQHVQLDLMWSTESLNLSLTDDGVGFDPAHPLREGHYGLVLMREAIEAMQGVTRLDSRFGEGTRLEISIPIARRDISPRQKGGWTEESFIALEVGAGGL